MKALLKQPLHLQIFWALLAAAAAGYATTLLPERPAAWLFDAYRIVGSIFLNALKMISVPLVAAAVIHGIAGAGGGQGFGRLGLKTAVFYLATTALAVLTGLVAINLLQPGLGPEGPARELLGLAADAEEVAARVGDRSLQDFADIVIRMVPANIFASAAEGDLLGLIVFSLLFGFFLARVPGAPGDVFRQGLQGFLEAMLRLTDFILRFAPIGVFALVARVVATTGFDAWRPLLLFLVSVLLALGWHTLVNLPLLLLVLGRIDPRRHFRAMAPALVTAFSTSSSTATVPVTLDCLEKRAGVSRRVSSFVIPLGATVNMDGTALYECAAALFIAQAYGLELSLGVQFTVVILAILTSIGVAGIPAASLVAIVVILQAVGLPAEGIGLLMATDRILDMCRTTVNVFGDTCGAVVIARSEGESGVLRS